MTFVGRSSFVLSFLGMCLSANAQNISCIKTFEEAPASGVAELVPTEVEKLIQELGKKIGVDKQSIMVIPCHFYNGKVGAFYAEGNLGVKNGEYIIYNPQWVQEVIGSGNRAQAIALFSHEVGHFLDRHFTARKDLKQDRKELEADKFAGCAVARMGEKWEELEELLTHIRPKQSDGLYPSRAESIEAAKMSFTDCGGKPNACRIPENGVESWGFERTVSRWSNWRGGGFTQDGYCGELVAQLRSESPEELKEIKVLSREENTRNTCPPFNCPQYKFFCSVTVRGKPVYKEQDSPNCP
ncbi:hypothetical protein ELH05_01125 [Rhizobium ruizarguesonis]|uniref:hypothetical protein n=1 Tax=Rhizobium ruizarguesonis TaxID=2081791 RepID=UPI001030B695|nr:hypothetical protein [Rhizobium ruizarguesonis]TBE26564.1 hypothetical protein ELH05_01125 [Rhizobium ruizarguesonis]